MSFRVQIGPVQKRMLISWTGKVYMLHQWSKSFSLVFQFLYMRYSLIPCKSFCFVVFLLLILSYSLKDMIMSSPQFDAESKEQWTNVFISERSFLSITCISNKIRIPFPWWVCLNVNVQINRPAYSSINSGQDLTNNFKYSRKGHLHKYRRD